MMTQTCVTTSCTNMISTVVIDNPPDNYLDRAVLAELGRIVSEVHAENPDLRAVLLTAKGRNFSLGIDYRALAKLSKEEAEHLARVGHQLLGHIEVLQVPVIAALKGEATG